MKRIERSIPYFEALINSKADRWKLLQSFPSFVFNDFIEVLHNVVLGQIDSSSYKKRLQKYRNTLIDMVNINGIKAKKRNLMKRFLLDAHDNGIKKINEKIKRISKDQNVFINKLVVVTSIKKEVDLYGPH